MDIAEVDLDCLFRPIRIKSLDLPNRIVMAPMTRGLAPGGTPGLAHANYYARRAMGGVGLVITEGTVIDRPAAKDEPNVPHFYGEALEGWKQVIDAVHGAGGKIAPQLWHAGASPKRPRGDWAPQPVDSPSGVAFDFECRSKPMSDAAIADAIDGFARSAAAAQALGCDAIELHGAHGYLIDQFFWEKTNLRGDAWGGPGLDERSRFGLEVIKAVRAAVSPDMVLSMRLSQWKIQDYTAVLAPTPDALAAWLEPMVDAGVDLFHCSLRRFWTPEYEGSDLNLAGWTKKLTGKPTIAVGMVGLGQGDFHYMDQSFEHMATLAHMMERGDFDLIAVGRMLIANPEWPRLMREGRYSELRDFDRSTMGELI